MQPHRSQNQTREDGTLSGPRALAAAALAWGAVYIGWRTTTLGSGWDLALSIPWLLAEIWALAQLALLTVQGWRVAPPARPPRPAPPGTVPRTDVVIDAHQANPDEVERSLVGTTALVGCGRVTVVDSRDRDEIRARTDRFHAAYVVDPEITASTAAVVHDHTSSGLYVWLDAGQVPMPSMLRSLIERFDDAELAVCQVAVGLLNPDSLVHLRGGRDEDALLRDVIGPGLHRLGSAPWFGPASMVRRAAVDSSGGFDRNDPAAVPRALTRLHRDGWSSGFESRRLVRATAADSLDEYLRRRRHRVVEGLRVFGTPEDPRRMRGLAWQHRLAHFATAMSFGTGLRQFLQLAILTAVLLVGRLPFDASIGDMVVMWGSAAALALAARRALGRGAMGVGDWVRHGWRTAGADAGALWSSFRKQASSERAERNETSGLAALGRMRALTVATVTLELALVARAVTLFDGDFLPRLTTAGRVVVLVTAMFVLASMVDVLQVVVLRQQRRRHHRLQTSLPLTIGDAETRSVDLSPRGVGLLMASAPQVGATTRFSVVLPTIDGLNQHVEGTAIVRSAEPNQAGRWRVGLEFVNLSDTARLALIAYCAIGHAVQAPVEITPELTAPSHLDVTRVATQQRSLQTLTGTAAIAGLALLSIGPAATAASAAAAAVESVCVTTTDGAPIEGSVIEQRSAGEWSVVGTTGPAGCVAVADVTTDDAFAVSHLGDRIEVSVDDDAGTTLFVPIPDHRVLVLDTEGRPVPDAAVRYYLDGWRDATATDGSAVLIPAIGSPSDVEVTWRGARHVQAFAPTTTVVLARIRGDAGVEVAEIDRGDGWEPFEDGIEVLPGRLLIRLADDSLHKLEVPGGHELRVPSGVLTQLDIERPTAPPVPTPPAPTPQAATPQAPTPQAATPEESDPDPTATADLPTIEPTAESPSATPIEESPDAAGETPTPEATP